MQYYWMRISYATGNIFNMGFKLAHYYPEKLGSRSEQLVRRKTLQLGEITLKF